MLTVGYTVRFLVAVFGPGPDTEVGPRRWAMTVPAVVLAAAGLVGFIGLSAVNTVVQPAATELNPGSGAYALLRWPGPTLGLAVSLGIIVAGATLGLVAARRAPTAAPMPVGAEMADASIDRVLWLAPRLTARIQHGSLRSISPPWPWPPSWRRSRWCSGCRRTISWPGITRSRPC